MNILIDARPLTIVRPGGVTKVMEAILPHLLEELRDHQVILGTTGWHTPNLTRFLAPHVEHHHLKAPNKLLSLLTATNLSSFDRFFSVHQPDRLLLFNLGHVGSPRIPYDLIVHDLALFIEPTWFSLRSRLWHFAVHGERSIKKARHLFAVSEYTKQSLIDRFHLPAQRITSLPFGALLMAEAEPLPKELQNKNYLLVLGGNDRRKNVACVVKAFEELHKNHPDLTLVLVGTPSLRPSSFVHLFDRPSDGLLRTLFEHCTAFLYPSWYEGFGLPLHEAAIFHKPCLASTAGALPETAPSGTLFAPPAKPQFWLEAMKLILDHPSRYQTTSRLDSTGWKKSAELIKRSIDH